MTHNATNETIRKQKQKKQGKQNQQITQMENITDEQLEGVIEAITGAANSGKVGDGKIFITTLDDVIRIRTGETGGDAV